MTISELYLSEALFICFDNGGEGGAGEGGSGEGGEGSSGEGGEGSSGEGGEGSEGGRTFSQDELNKILAEDRRKHQQKFKSLETEYEKLLENKNLSEEQRTNLETQLDDIRKQHMSKEERLRRERKQVEEQYQTQLRTAQDEAKQYKNLFESSTISRALQDAAVENEAFSPQQIVGLLTPSTKMVEVLSEEGKPTGQYKPMVDFIDVNEEGQEVPVQMSPAESVKRMKELSDRYGNLFKSGVVSGIGSNSATAGLSAGADGRVDPTKISRDQYHKLRKENPEALGLKRRRSY